MKKNKIFAMFIISIFMLGCKTKGVNNISDQRDSLITNQANTKHEPSDLTGVKDSAYRNLELLITKDDKTLKEEKYDNGIHIQWLEQGNGKTLEDNHAYRIQYEVLLDDGSVIDGNKIINRKWVHFLLGYQLQGKGWDFALSKLKVGDFAKIKIPSSLARGKIGIKGLIPPDASNTLTIKILDEIKPDRIIDGTKVWVLASTDNKQSTVMDSITKALVDYTIGTPSNPRFLNTRNTPSPAIVQYSDKGIVQGLKKSIIGTKRGDNLWITVPAEQAYGKAGFTEMIKPNEPLFYELFVLEVK